MPERYFPCLPILLCCVASACSSGDGATGYVPGDRTDERPFAAIAADSVVHLTGTEPFWGGRISGSTLTYETPSATGDEGVVSNNVAVERFAGRGGLSFSGRLEGRSLDLAVTSGNCDDGMSGRRYPFTATLRVGEEVRRGCAWTDARPFSGPDRP